MVHPMYDHSMNPIISMSNSRREIGPERSHCLPSQCPLSRVQFTALRRNVGGPTVLYIRVS
jgi:hypothetical protein